MGVATAKPAELVESSFLVCPRAGAILSHGAGQRLRGIAEKTSRWEARE